MRTQARFYRDGVQTQACDSGPRRWAAGDDAERRLAEAPPVRPPRGGFYPAVPSLAGEVSPARKRFIERTDATCLATYPATQAAETPRAYVAAHAAQLRALEALGTPPEGEALHRRWLENFHERVHLERRIVALNERGDFAEAEELDRLVGQLKIERNTAGQRFGLRICTSNGPDRTPAPR